MLTGTGVIPFYLGVTQLLPLVSYDPQNFILIALRSQLKGFQKCEPEIFIACDVSHIPLSCRGYYSTPILQGLLCRARDS